MWAAADLLWGTGGSSENHRSARISHAVQVAGISHLACVLFDLCIKWTSNMSEKMSIYTCIKKIIFHEFHLLLVSREGRAEGLLLIKPYLFEAISCPVLAKQLRWQNTENFGRVSGTSWKKSSALFLCMFFLPISNKHKLTFERWINFSCLHIFYREKGTERTAP